MEWRFASGTSRIQTQLELSPREQQVLNLLLRAQSLKEIANAQNISVNSAKGHVMAIYRKVQVRSARELIARHAKIGPPEDPFLASICALLESRTLRDLIVRCVEALRVWTGATEATVLSQSPTTPPPARGFVIPMPAALGAPGHVFWLSAPSGGWAAGAPQETAEEVARIAARCAAAQTPARVPPRPQGRAPSRRLRVS